MHLLKQMSTGDTSCVSDQQAGFMLESAWRDGNMIRHTPIDEADVGLLFTDEDRMVWLLFPMGPSTLDHVVLFDQESGNG